MHVQRLYHHSFLGNAAIILVGNGTQLQRIRYEEKPEHVPYDSNAYSTIVTQLDEYFAGKRTQFDCAIATQGTTLQEQHWHHLRCIPYGHTITYSELAAQSDSKNAVRAVASACAINPVPIIIPCHRVIGKDGHLRGFAWGLEVKQKLLDLERQH